MMANSSDTASLRIAYIGVARGNSILRARALERLGHRVCLVDPYTWLGRSRWILRWLFHTGGFGVDAYLASRIKAAVTDFAPDLVYVDQGEFLGPRTVSGLRSFGVPAINYIVDNPFSGRDGLRFRYFLKALPLYDLLAIVRESSVARAKQLGARDAVFVWQSADEVAHVPRNLSNDVVSRFKSEVAFVGTWMPERGAFFATLIEKGVPLSIWGDRWQRAREWSILAPHWRGPGLYDPDSYAAAIQASKICIGLVSKENFDLHTSRSVEIPAIGTLFCAERTSAHMALYEDGAEAVFFDDADECAERCLALLADDDLRSAIACRGHERAIRNDNYNEPILSSLLSRAISQNGRVLG